MGYGGRRSVGVICVWGEHRDAPWHRKSGLRRSKRELNRSVMRYEYEQGGSRQRLQVCRTVLRLWVN